FAAAWPTPLPPPVIKTAFPVTPAMPASDVGQVSNLSLCARTGWKPVLQYALCPEPFVVWLVCRIFEKPSVPSRISPKEPAPAMTPTCDETPPSPPTRLNYARDSL